ncbi:MAG: hypothetical protein WC141_05150 [Arcobacteraceae bacterium]
MNKFNNKMRLICVSLSVLLLSGCAPKQDDHLAVKTLKHASMTPVYAGEVAHNAFFFVLVSPIIAAALVKKGIDTLVIDNEENNESVNNQDIAEKYE